MENAACNVLTSALEELCRQTLPLLPESGDMLDVAIEDFEDRLQIIVEHHGARQPTVGVDSFIASCVRESNRGIAGAQMIQTVDQIEDDARDGSIRTTLVKYLHLNNGNGR
jgi:hypothetical protein